MLCKPLGVKALIAENLILRKQLITASRKHKRSPKLSFLDRLLLSSKSHRKSGPKGPSKKIINLILEMKKSNPQFGCLRISMQIQNMFDIKTNKDIVRLVLEKFHFNHPNKNYFNQYRSHTSLDTTTRRIIGFAVHTDRLSGASKAPLNHFNQPINHYYL